MHGRRRGGACTAEGSARVELGNYGAAQTYLVVRRRADVAVEGLFVCHRCVRHVEDGICFCEVLSNAPSTRECFVSGCQVVDRAQPGIRSYYGFKS